MVSLSLQAFHLHCFCLQIIIVEVTLFFSLLVIFHNQLDILIELQPCLIRNTQTASASNKHHSLVVSGLHREPDDGTSQNENT